MTHPIDEITLQRCVDGELSDQERAELLKQLHHQGSLESWKTLALSFVEHQVFSKVFAEETGHEELKSFQLARPIPMERLPEQTPVQPPLLHRRVRPWFSVAASLLVGMIVGVGGHFMMKSSSDQDLMLAKNDMVSVPGITSQESSSPLPEHPGNEALRPGRPVMNVHLTGLGSSGARPVSVPVYSPEQWQTLQQSGASQTAELPREVRQMLESQGMQVDHQRHWYRARLNDGREILVPTETMRVHHAIQ